MSAGVALAAGTQQAAQTTSMEQTEVAAGEFNATAAQLFPTAFGELQVSDASDVTLSIVTRQDSTSLLQSLRAKLGTSVNIHVVTVPRSFRALNSLEEQVAGDYSALASQGVSFAKLVPDVAAGTVSVTLEAPQAAPSDAVGQAQAAPAGQTPTASVSQAQATLDARYGSGLLTVEQQTQTILPTDYTRYDDSAPWWGGDQTLWESPGGPLDCSSGLPAEYNGQYGVLSASHCAPLGAPIHITNWYLSSNPFQQVSTLGTVAGFWGWNASNTCTLTGGNTWCMDFEFIATQGSSQGDVYNGPAGCSNDNSSTCQGGYRVHSYVLATPGSYMAADGATSGQVTNQYVTQEDVCATLYDVWSGTYHPVCNLGDMYNSNACQPGDSGGPTYLLANGGVTATGIIVAGDQPNPLSPHGDCYFDQVSFLLSWVPGITLVYR
jgi:hypothetical protein